MKASPEFIHSLPTLISSLNPAPAEQSWFFDLLISKLTLILGLDRDLHFELISKSCSTRIY